MSILSIKDGGDVRRAMLACAMDVSDGAGEPEYLVIGYKVNSSTLDYEIDEEDDVDIRGEAYGSINKVRISQTFDPNRLTSGENGKLNAKIIQYLRDGDLAKLSQFKCLIIYGFLESTGEPLVADRYEACTIVPQSLGGESWVELPFTVKFGGKVTKGTANGRIGIVEFTEGKAAGASAKTAKVEVDSNGKK